MDLHNTKQYNGYKVYGDYDRQITDETSKEIVGYIIWSRTYINILKKFDRFEKNNSNDFIFGLEESCGYLPKSNILKYILEDNFWLVFRTSGTEPKMKIYLAIETKSLKKQ